MEIKVNFDSVKLSTPWGAEETYAYLPNEGSVNELVELLKQLAQANDLVENESHYVKLGAKGPHVGWFDKRHYIGVVDGYQSDTHGLHVTPTGKASIELSPDLHIKWEDISSQHAS